MVRRRPSPPSPSLCSPISPPSSAWALETAALHPTASIIGTDLSPIQPTYVPPNCTWLLDDANHPWPSDFRARFDLVHTRSLGLGVEDWDRFVGQAHAALKPGTGWLELQEFCLPLGCDDGSSDGTAIQQWGLRMTEAAARIGVDVGASAKHARRMRDRGFVDVREVRLMGPIGPWAKGRVEKELGVLGLNDLYGHLEGLSSKLFAVLGWSEDRTARFCASAKQDILNPGVSFSFFFVSFTSFSLSFLFWVGRLTWAGGVVRFIRTCP